MFIYCNWMELKIRVRVVQVNGIGKIETKYVIVILEFTP